MQYFLFRLLIISYPLWQNEHTVIKKIWYHRRAILEIYGPREFLDSELDYIEKVLEEDSKNYHAWSYRQWILMSVDEESVWEKEMDFGTLKKEKTVTNKQ